MDITDRVRKLIALARTAAREAVRLIAKHGLLNGQPQPQPKPRPETWNGPIMCKPSWHGSCEVCGSKLWDYVQVFWLGKRVRHAACHRFAQGGRR